MDVLLRESRPVLAIFENRCREVGIASFSTHGSIMTLSQFCDSTTYVNTITTLFIQSPRKVLFPSSSYQSLLLKIIKTQFQHFDIELIERKHFSENKGSSVINDLVCANDSISIDKIVSSKYLCLASAAALTHYIQSVEQQVFLAHSLNIVYKSSEGSLLLDPMTIKALELISPNSDINLVSRSAISGKPIKSVLQILNHTKTSSGLLLLRSNLLEPPRDYETIKLRQMCVQELLSDEKLYFDLIAALSSFPDLNPVFSNLTRSPQSLDGDITQAISFSEARITSLLKLKAYLAAIPNLTKALHLSSNPYFQAILEFVDKSTGLIELQRICEAAMVEKNSGSTGNGATHPAHHHHHISSSDIIYALKEGIHGLLDAARRVYSERVEDIQALFVEHQKHFSQTIGPIKLHYCNSRGYFMSADENQIYSNHISPQKNKQMQSKRNNFDKMVVITDDEEAEEDMTLDKKVQSERDGSEIRPTASSGNPLPPNCILTRKRGKRWQFSTSEMSALNERLKESKYEILLLTTKLLLGIQQEICDHFGDIYKLVDAISTLDLLQSFATFAIMSSSQYCIPDIIVQLDEGDSPITCHEQRIQFTESAHPLLVFSGSNPTPNSLESIASSGTYFNIITGKNNSGKTTLMSQIALFIILAHLGCPVLASSAKMSLFDRVILRIPAQQGGTISCYSEQAGSSFYREMKDLSYILHVATPKSIILMDEMGKSTSAVDGIPICIAFAERIIQRGITTFFATHWLEMATELHQMFPRAVQLYRIAICEGKSNSRPNSHLGLDEHSLNSLEDHQLVIGCEVDSGYGIQLARKCGWPSNVVSFADQLRMNALGITSSTENESHFGDPVESHEDTDMKRVRSVLLYALMKLKSSNQDQDSKRKQLTKLAVEWEAVKTRLALM